MDSPAPTPSSGETTLSLPLLAAGVVVLVLGMILALFAWGGSMAIPEQELARRCAESTPQWDNYQEDIKAQVGARPVAEWSGIPVAASYALGMLRLQFRVEGPWANREAAIPLLIKEPGGSVLTGHGRGDRQGSASYTIPLPHAGESLPWVEVQYPHHRLRMTLDAKGTWQSP
ncbi:MAG: hypothetical protein RLZZ303_1525 [Candidatus Hydrogenedentota bacterium]|jgi:hypothetical protein